jgi:hypothetical protein
VPRWVGKAEILWAFKASEELRAPKSSTANDLQQDTEPKFSPSSDARGYLFVEGYMSMSFL